LRKLQLDPKAKNPSIDKELPILAKDLTDKEEPRFTTSRALKPPLSVLNFVLEQEIDELILEKLRSDRLLPRLTKASTERGLPRRPNDLIETVLPRETESSTESTPPPRNVL
jgi:hypothetical protein